MAIRVVYEDLSPLAKGDSMPTSTDKKDFVNMEDLKSEELTPFSNYALCLPRYSKLNGKYVNAPNEIPKSGLGYVSKSISKADGTFEKNPMIEILFTQNHTAVGLNLIFNEHSGDYADYLNIKWYRDEELLSDKDFRPNSANYSCMNNVELFNKILIEFKKTSKPYRYIFIGGVIYGIIRNYEKNEIMRINLLSEISQIGEELSINTFGFTLVSQTDTEYLFQKQQQLKLFNGDKLLGSYFIDTATRKSEKTYDIKCYDLIGILDQTVFMGGIYNGVRAGSILEKIFGEANIGYIVDNVTAEKLIYGYIPILTRREALCWICMATGSVADTTNSETVDIYRIDEEVKRNIDITQQYEGTKIENSVIVTGIKLTSYTYTEATDVVTVFEEILNGRTLIEFSEPLYGLSISGGTIEESGTNYAIITGTGSKVVLTGKVYNVSTKVTEKANPLIGALDIKNVVEVSDCTIISSNNAEEVAERVLSYYLKTKKVNAKIILGDNDLGDTVTIEAGFEGQIKGVIEKLEISANNKLAGKVVIR